jgi:hypothetical protein
MSFCRSALVRALATSPEKMDGSDQFVDRFLEVHPELLGLARVRARKNPAQGG